MFKFLVLVVAIIYSVNAGVILDHRPVVAVAHGASSYQNSNSLSVHPVPVVAHRAAVVHAPVAIAHAPIAVAHAPIAVAHTAVVHPVAIGIHHH